MGAGRGREPAGALGPIVGAWLATVVKLVVGTLAFAGAYAGVAGAGGTASLPAAGDAGPRTVLLSTRALPAESDQVPEAGMVTAALATPPGACPPAYRAQGVIDPGAAGGTAGYRWRLRRWDPGARAWRTVLASGRGGFTGTARAVEWRPAVTTGPGRYRVELAVAGKGTTAGEAFTVAC
ncbi:hypothetical protein Sru01_34400 [Sphaerisporangium rufum]|uniref:Uncharacterized protein n=1 Tax=Sphaerisporangium rufum TaxID=1381558 RepID=A0A919R3M3_9ACTN|nr:hypothetical protein [Sphaerisporangium rufum]GII78458.1 hypothetical protein Sru01_34400 [Sphaerisporangium rufum]